MDAVLAGVSGWRRWGQWCAHFFVDGAHICSTSHSYAEGGIQRGLPPAAPVPAELSVGGLPFGRVCQRCAKLWARHHR